MRDSESNSGRLTVKVKLKSESVQVEMLRWRRTEKTRLRFTTSCRFQVRPHQQQTTLSNNRNNNLVIMAQICNTMYHIEWQLSWIVYSVWYFYWIVLLLDYFGWYFYWLVINNGLKLQKPLLSWPADLKRSQCEQVTKMVAKMMTTMVTEMVPMATSTS